MPCLRHASDAGLKWRPVAALLPLLAFASAGLLRQTPNANQLWPSEPRGGPRPKLQSAVVAAAEKAPLQKAEEAPLQKAKPALWDLHRPAGSPGASSSCEDELEKRAVNAADVAERAVRAAVAHGANKVKRRAAQKAYGQLLHSVKALGDNRTKTERVPMERLLHWDVKATDPVTTLSAKVQELANIARDSSSSSLNDLLQAVAASLSLGPAQEFLQSLRICAKCRNFERAGGLYDGGYVMCADGLNASGLAGAYSYGIGGDDQWGNDVAQRYEVPLFQYDCLDTREPKLRRGVEAKFTEECIQGNNERRKGPYATLSEQMRHNGQGRVRNSSLLLKLDVEGAEYDILSQESSTALGALAKFRQINAELHHIDHEAHDPRSLRAMRTLLNAGFAVVHLHGNNHNGLVHIGPYSVPEVIEVTLIRQEPGTTCEAHAPRQLPEDTPCTLDREELPLPRLPK